MANWRSTMAPRSGQTGTSRSAAATGRFSVATPAAERRKYCPAPSSRYKHSGRWCRIGPVRHNRPGEKCGSCAAEPTSTEPLASGTAEAMYSAHGADLPHKREAGSEVRCESNWLLTDRQMYLKFAK